MDRTESAGPASGATTNRDGEAPVVKPVETTDEATVHEEGTGLERTI